MIIKPISKEVLIHEVTYEEFVPGDGFETEDGFKEPITLTNVLVQYLSNIARNNIAEALNYNALLFFDVVNSKSSGVFEFKEKSRVTFDGKQMIVEKINPIYAFKLHHYEVGLT